jgi:large subunit ribosomal protein L17
MRHGKKFNHLGRTASHRRAMLSNMASSLILHKRISTTLAKAKELKKHVEPLVTRAKEDTTHNRRIAFSFLQSKEAIKTLFGEISEKVGTRPGGYTRIIKTGFRLGDNAEMCIIELVDFNELMIKGDKPAKKTTRRSRRGGAKPEDKEGTETTAQDKKSKAAEGNVSPEKEISDVKEETTSKEDEGDKPSEENSDAKDDNKTE